MAGSGVQERVRVSVRRVKGARAPSPGGYRVATESSMSEYRPGVTSPHTLYLPQRALFTLRLAPLLLAQPPLLLVSLLLVPHSLRTLYGTPAIPRNIPLTWRLFSDSSLGAYSISLCRARHVVFFSHHPGLSRLRRSLWPSIFVPFVSYRLSS